MAPLENNSRRRYKNRREFTDKDDNTWTVADSPNIIFDLANDLEANFPSKFRFHSLAKNPVRKTGLSSYYTNKFLVGLRTERLTFYAPPKARILTRNRVKSRAGSTIV